MCTNCGSHCWWQPTLHAGHQYLDLFRPVLLFLFADLDSITADEAVLFFLLLKKDQAVTVSVYLASRRWGNVLPITTFTQGLYNFYNEFISDMFLPLSRLYSIQLFRIEMSIKFWKTFFQYRRVDLSAA